MEIVFQISGSVPLSWGAKNEKRKQLFSETLFLEIKFCRDWSLLRCSTLYSFFCSLKNRYFREKFCTKLIKRLETSALGETISTVFLLTSPLVIYSYSEEFKRNLIVTVITVIFIFVIYCWIFREDFIKDKFANFSLNNTAWYSEWCGYSCKCIVRVERGRFAMGIEFNTHLQTNTTDL